MLQQDRAVPIVLSPLCREAIVEFSSLVQHPAQRVFYDPREADGEQFILASLKLEELPTDVLKAHVEASCFRPLDIRCGRLAHGGHVERRNAGASRRRYAWRRSEGRLGVHGWDPCGRYFQSAARSAAARAWAPQGSEFAGELEVSLAHTATGHPVRIEAATLACHIEELKERSV